MLGGAPKGLQGLLPPASCVWGRHSCRWPEESRPSSSEQGGLRVPSGRCFLRPRLLSAQGPQVVSAHWQQDTVLRHPQPAGSCLLWYWVEGKSVGSGTSRSVVRTPSPSHVSVALGELLYFPRPQFLHLRSGENRHLPGVCRENPVSSGPSRSVQTKHSGQARRKKCQWKRPAWGQALTVLLKQVLS